MTSNILVVDDNKVIHMMVKKALRPFDCNVFEGENGLEGLKIALRVKPDLILLDINMPVMDGIEMLKKIKGAPYLKDIPVIILSANAGEKNVIKIAKMGVNNFMSKPFKSNEFLQRANTLITLCPQSQDIAAETSHGYFSLDGKIQILETPEKVNRHIVAEVETQLQPEIMRMVKTGLANLILDTSKTNTFNISLLQLIITIVKKCRKSKLALRIVGPPSLRQELQDFDETSNILIDVSLNAAKAAF